MMLLLWIWQLKDVATPAWWMSGWAFAGLGVLGAACGGVFGAGWSGAAVGLLRSMMAVWGVARLGVYLLRDRAIIGKPGRCAVRRAAAGLGPRGQRAGCSGSSRRRRSLAGVRLVVA